MEALWDREEDLQDEIDAVQKIIDKARRRGQPTAEKELELAAKISTLSEQMRSPAHRRGMTQVRSIMTHLPELLLRLPALDPYWGTDAQGVPQRDFNCYSGTCVVCLWASGLGLFHKLCI